MVPKPFTDDLRFFFKKTIIGLASCVASVYSNKKSSITKGYLSMDVKKIDGLIALYEKRVSALKNLRSLVESDPGLAQEVVQAFMPDSLPLPSTEQLRQPKKAGQYDRIVQFMEGGEWRTLPEIADGINAKKTSIAPYFYRDDTKDKFESRKNPNNLRMMQWRLKQPEGPGETHGDSMGARD